MYFPALSELPGGFFFLFEKCPIKEMLLPTKKCRRESVEVKSSELACEDTIESDNRAVSRAQISGTDASTPRRSSVWTAANKRKDFSTFNQANGLGTGCWWS